MARARWVSAVWLALPAGVLIGPALDGYLVLVAVAAAVVVAGLRWVTSARACLIAAFCLAAGLTGLALERHDRIAWERVAEQWLPEPGRSREMHFRGRLLEPATAASNGERLLRLRGRPDPPPPAALDRELDLRLVVAPSSATVLRALDALRAGEELRVWCSVRRPRGLGEPGWTEPAAALRAQGLDAIGAVKHGALVERLGAATPGPRAWAGRLKQLARERLDEVLGEHGRVRALSGAMLLGDRAALGPDEVRMLRDSGLAHLVAISGLHVGLLIALAHGALKRLRVPDPLPWIVTVVSISGFALMVGPLPSVLRAVVGSAIVLFGRTLGREGRGLHGLAVVAGLLVAVRPALARDAGFQLTLIATAGLVTAMRAAPRSRLVLAAWISVATYVATAPILALQFGRLAPVGLLANLLAVPLSTGVLFAALGCVAFAGVPLASALAASSCEWTARALWEVAERSVAWESGSFVVASPRVSVVLACYAASGLAIWCSERDRLPRLRTTAGAVAVLLLLTIHLGPPPEAPRCEEAVLLDVGQGLALALRGAEGGTVLIDAGGTRSLAFDPGERVVVPHLLRWGRHLNVLAVTHDDLDHAGGAFAVLRALDVGELWLGPGSSKSPRLAALVDLARRQGTAIVLAERGFGHAVAGFPVEVLAPARADRELGDNDRSLVLRAGHPGARLLVPGDLEGRGERALAATGVALQAEALVLSHHGSSSSSGPEFLRLVDADWGLAAVGFGNRFGHPDSEVVRRLERGGTRVLRSDLHGRIHMRSGADGWHVASVR